MIGAAPRFHSVTACPTRRARAPLGTPPAIVKKLNAEFIKAAHAPEVVRKVAEQAVEMYTTTPEDMGKLIASDFDRLGKVVREAGIKVQ